MGSDTNTINQAAVTSIKDLSATGGSQASLRVIWDLADLANGSWMVTVPGVSGQFNSPHYGDQLPIWAAGHLRPVRTCETDIGCNTKSRTRFGQAPSLRVAHAASLVAVFAVGLAIWARSTK